MKTLRLFITTCLACVLAAAAIVHAQTQYPVKPIRLVVGFGAGGATDVVARYYGQRWAEALNVAFVVDNKPGASQLVGIKTVQSAPADGYTLFFGSGSAFSQGPGVRTDLPFDPLKDFTLIGLVSSAPGVIIVAPSLPVANLRELIEYSKQNPAKLNYGSSGLGSASHLQTEYMMYVTGMKMTHIPYKSAADIVREISAGAVHVGITPMEATMSQVAGGRIRVLAVTGPRRYKGLPDVPSVSESGIKGLEGIDPYTYYALVGPVGLPAAVVTKLSDTLNRVSKTPAVAAQVREQLFNEPGISTPASFRKFIEGDLVKWKQLRGSVKIADS